MSEQLDRLTVDQENLGLELTRLIGVANDRLGNFAAEEVPPAELRDEIQDTLDVLWAKDYEECAFSGLCMVREVGTEQEKTDFVEHETGFSDGFWVTRFGSREKGFWAVGLGFEQAGRDLTEPDRYSILNLTAQHTVLPVSAVEEAFPEGLDFPSIQKVLTQSSTELAKLLDSKAFYGLDVDEQRCIIDAGIQTTLEECVDFGGLMDRHVEVQAQRGYVGDHDEQAGYYYDEVSLSDVVIKGNCESIAVLARWQISNDIPIRSPEELIDADAGFFLVVVIDEDTAWDCCINPGERLFIPISGQDIKMELGSRVGKKQV
jgi:hypothetical protein